MYALSTLHRLNEQAVAQSHHRHETETTRHCSYTKSAKGYVLHSAKQRSTVFLPKGARADLFRTLLLAARTPAQLDKLVESYFA